MLAIIPARSGSKGLPGKNILELSGIPLIAYTIMAARNAKNIDRVVVTTDSAKIADVSKQYGADVPFLRPKELSQDHSLVLDAFLYVVDRLAKEENNPIDSFAALNPTTPFRSSEDIDNAINLFYKKEADSVLSFTKQEHPIEWSRYIKPDGRFEPIVSEGIHNRQAYKPSYRFNGAVYIYKTDLIRKRRMYSDNSFSYVMPTHRSVDIDTAEDFDYAQYMLRRMDEQRG